MAILICFSFLNLTVVIRHKVSTLAGKSQRQLYCFSVRVKQRFLNPNFNFAPSKIIPIGFCSNKKLSS